MKSKKKINIAPESRAIPSLNCVLVEDLQMRLWNFLINLYVYPFGIFIHSFIWHQNFSIFHPIFIQFTSNWYRHVSWRISLKTIHFDRPECFYPPESTREFVSKTGNSANLRRNESGFPSKISFSKKNGSLIMNLQGMWTKKVAVMVGPNERFYGWFVKKTWKSLKRKRYQFDVNRIKNE